MEIVNTSLLRHPVNYLTVVLMLIIAGFAGSLMLEYIGITYAGKEDTNPAITMKPAAVAA